MFVVWNLCLQRAVIVDQPRHRKIIDFHGKRTFGVASLEQIRMVAHFSKLHHQIHQIRGETLVGILSFSSAIGVLQKIFDANFFLEGHVEQPLPRCQRTVDHDFDFVGQLILDVFLDTSQHEWFQNHVQAGYLFWNKENGI